MVERVFRHGLLRLQCAGAAVAAPALPFGARPPGGWAMQRGGQGRVTWPDESGPTAGPAGELVGLADEALIARVAAADHAAFELLVGRHLDRVHRIAWRMLGDHGEAEEVAQETLLRMWMHAASFDPAHGALLSTWLHRIVLNLCLDRQRRRRPAAPVEAAEGVADAAPHPLARLAAAEAAAAVAAALATLPERQRMAVVLSYYERLSNAEAAAVLGIGVGALEALLVRARKALRARLAGRI
jgi:RNA polymerase sigma-70 factor (ECF subfamily)